MDYKLVKYKRIAVVTEAIYFGGLSFHDALEKACGIIEDDYERN